MLSFLNQFFLEKQYFLKVEQEEMSSHRNHINEYDLHLKEVFTILKNSLVGIIELQWLQFRFMTQKLINIVVTILTIEISC